VGPSNYFKICFNYPHVAHSNCNVSSAVGFYLLECWCLLFALNAHSTKHGLFIAADIVSDSGPSGPWVEKVGHVYCQVITFHCIRNYCFACVCSGRALQGAPGAPYMIHIPLGVTIRTDFGTVLGTVLISCIWPLSWTHIRVLFGACQWFGYYQCNDRLPVVYVAWSNVCKESSICALASQCVVECVI